MSEHSIPPADQAEVWERATEEVGALLSPDTVAVVGASNTEGKPGNVLFSNILQNEFTGTVYPVNPKADEVLGRQAYAGIEDVPEPLDLVLFAVPGPIIKDLLPACAEQDVTSVVIVSAGFGEAVDAERRDLQAELVEDCREYGIRAVGPNTTGMVSMKRDLVASFMPFPRWHDGPIALAAQTGIFAGVYMEELMARDVQRLGYNYSVGLGNKIDLDETDFLRYAAQDDDVEVIQLYLECIRHPEEFFPTAARVTQEKPVVLLKSARTAAGREAARWHTGSEATVDQEVEAACQRAGIVRARTVPEFMNYAKGFAYQPPPRGRNVAVLSLSGANAVMVSDYIAESCLELADLSRETLELVKELVPDWQPVRNPIDQWLALPSGPRTAQEVPLNGVLDDPDVDAVVTVHLASGEPDFDDIGAVYAAARDAHPEKPILSYIMGAETKAEWIESMETTDVPVFDSAHAAVDTLEQLYRWQRYRNGLGTYDTDVADGEMTI